MYSVPLDLPVHLVILVDTVAKLLTLHLHLKISLLLISLVPLLNDLVISLLDQVHLLVMDPQTIVLLDRTKDQVMDQVDKAV